MSAPHKRGGGFNHYSNHNNKRPRPNQPTYNSNPRGNAHVISNGPQSPELSVQDMHTGLVALLDRVVAAETKPAPDKDILYHAAELRRLLCNRTHPASDAAKQALDQKRPNTAAHVAIPSYIHRKVEQAKDLPPLPPITEPHLHEAVFTHQSFHVTNQTVHQGINLGLDYERLEFLGDAYIELIASRALYNRFPQVDIPQLSSWRERLVENLALGKFSEAYGFPDRLRAKIHWDKSSKAWKKVVADLFEAYVAGIILSDAVNGFATAEEWLDKLWAPQLLGFEQKVIENPRARDDLQKLVFLTHVKLDYREERPMTYTNAVQKFYLGVYLTGWGYENEWLGSGEGQNKAQAAINAAIDAIKRNSTVLQDAARQKKEVMELRAKEREAKAAAEAAVEGQGEQQTATVTDSAGVELKTTPKKIEDSHEDASSEKKRKKHKAKKDKKSNRVPEDES